MDNQAPRKQGLYDPDFEHDSCGVGFVADLNGRKSHKILKIAIECLVRMHHRGASGAEEATGDGAGILAQIPHKFFARECERLHIILPEAGEYAVGMMFLPRDESLRKHSEATFERIATEHDLNVLGWRDVPTNNWNLGESAKSAEPFIRQVFVAKTGAIADEAMFERKLYVTRRWTKELLTREDARYDSEFYVASLSARTIIYKGMLTTHQLASYYLDLNDLAFETGLAVVHSRFSTNTFPSWNRAQPLRYIAHNGEINTLRGNVNWMYAREHRLKSELFGEDFTKTLSILDAYVSDSGAFDNALEMLHLAGRELPHGIMMMIPEPLSELNPMSDAKRAFYEFHSALMEPWDGPASITFTNGEIIGAVLDRNGLRPSRYTVTTDGLVVMASEVGVFDVEPEKVVRKGRLQPGKMFLVDTRAGRIIADEEIKEKIATAKPYREWIDEHQIHINDLPRPFFTHRPDHDTILERQRAFGYTEEELRVILRPMAVDGAEAIGSMGNDTPPAVLSKRPQLLYNYFKQLFAQVTNPPIDAIREELVTSTDTMIGRDDNLFEPSPEAAHHIRLNSFILTNEELEKLRYLGDSESVWGKSRFRSITIPMLFDREHGAQGLEWALEKLCHQTSRAIDDGYDLFILSDRQMNAHRVPIPALLAVSAIHHHLTREGKRTQVGFVLESGEPREVHHFALLLGYGATAINPYLAFETISDEIKQGIWEIDEAKAIANFVKSVGKGVVKICSKMGISTIRSYTGAQIFEAVGIGDEVIGKYFTRTPSRIGGIGLAEIAGEALARHDKAFFPLRKSELLETGGEYQWRKTGEYHLFNPATVHALQRATRDADYAAFKRYASLINDEDRERATLRSLLRFKTRTPVPIDDVEPVSEIVKRFKTGAISYGSISQESHETLAVAMNRLGGKSNTGEGGEDAERFVENGDGDSRKSKIKQVASGRFGVTSHYLVNAEEIQIKIAQGAKPGEGGQLPGKKIYPWIAKTRHSTPGVGLISPPPHHDIYSIEDLAQLIFDLKNANDRARIGVKLVSEAGVGTIAAGVAKAKADVILISGYDGGTGASPLTSLKHAGTPWEIGLAETHQTLVLNNLRSRVRLETDGQLKTGRDVVIAALLGAEEFGFSTAPLVSLGCVMMRVCHLNTCPVGIATQDPRLREKFSGSPEYVETFMKFIATEMREIMASLGFRTVDEMVGRTDVLEQETRTEDAKSARIDLSAVLHQPSVPAEYGRRFSHPQNHELESTLDRAVLLEICRPALEKWQPVVAELEIRNTDRATGTILGSAISRAFGAEGLPDGTIDLRFTGAAGQSFGAFLPRGVTMRLDGEANDYIGKGLSGGSVIVRPPRSANFPAHENIVIGNTAFYGATSGTAFVSGIAGERFGVRNSGADLVVEGVGDHGCEYMTGGRVVILGETGKNFAAGMSGGIAYVFDAVGGFASRCNPQMIKMSGVSDEAEVESLRGLIERHYELTESARAGEILNDWETAANQFVRVIPVDYERMITAQERFVSAGLSEEEAAMSAFAEVSA